MAIDETIQAAVSSLDEGVGRRLLRGLIAACCLLLLVWAYNGSQYRGLRAAEAMDSAQLGQNLAAGRGYVTRSIRPFDLWFLARHGRPADTGVGVPELWRPPLYPLLLAQGFRIVPTPAQAVDAGGLGLAERRIVLPFGWLCTGIAGLLVLASGRRLFGATAGAVAAAVFLLSERTLAAAIGGTSVPLVTALTAGTFYLALRAADLRGRQAPAWRWGLAAAAGGGIAGCAFLTQYAAGFGAIGALVLLASGFQRGRGTAVGLFVLAFALVAVPWLARNQRATGSPLGAAPYAALEASAAYRDDALARSPALVLRRDTGYRAIRLKVYDELRERFGRDFWLLGGGVATALFAVSLLVRFDSDPAQRAKWGVLLGVALLVAASAFSGHADGIGMMAPLIVVLGVGVFFELIARLPLAEESVRTALIGVLIAVAGLPTFLAIAGSPARPAYPPYAPALVRYVCDLMAPDEILAADIPWATAWYGDQPSLLIPPTVDDLIGLRAGGLAVNGVYLTTRLGDRAYVSGLLSGAEQSWLPLLNRQVPVRAPWTHGVNLPPGTRDQIFVTDRPRWAAAAGDGGA